MWPFRMAIYVSLSVSLVCVFDLSIIINSALLHFLQQQRIINLGYYAGILLSYLSKTKKKAFVNSRQGLTFHAQST